MNAEPKIGKGGANMTYVNRQTFTYESAYGPVNVVPRLGIYHDNNLYMALLSYDDELRAWDHFGNVTVNITQLPYLYSAIDTNNNGDKILAFLEENGFGKATGHTLQSGFCEYPVFHFDEKMLIQIDPEVYATYGALHGQSHTALSEKISQAKAQTEIYNSRNMAEPMETFIQTSLSTCQIK